MERQKSKFTETESTILDPFSKAKEGILIIYLKKEDEVYEIPKHILKDISDYYIERK